MDVGKFLSFPYGPSDLNLDHPPESGLPSPLIGFSSGLSADGCGPVFSCHACSRHFSALAAYETHLQTQHVTTQCPLCLAFLDQTHFSRHLYSHHRHNLDPQFLQSQNLTQCPTCLKVLNASYFMKHFKGFHQAHVCGQCSAVLAGEKAWEKHFKEHHHHQTGVSKPESSLGSFSCCHCNFSCSLEIEYERHLSVCGQATEKYDFEVFGEEEVVCELAVDPNQNVIELGQITRVEDPETREIRPIFVPVEASVWNSQAEKLCAELNPIKKSRKNPREVKLPDGSNGFDLSRGKRGRDLETQSGPRVGASNSTVQCRKVNFNSDCPTPQDLAKYHAPTHCPTILCHLCGAGFESKLALKQHACSLHSEISVKEEVLE